MKGSINLLTWIIKSIIKWLFWDSWWIWLVHYCFNGWEKLNIWIVSKMATKLNWWITNTHLRGKILNFLYAVFKIRYPLNTFAYLTLQQISCVLSMNKTLILVSCFIVFKFRILIWWFKQFVHTLTNMFQLLQTHIYLCHWIIRSEKNLSFKLCLRSFEIVFNKHVSAAKHLRAISISSSLKPLFCNRR